MLAIRQTRQRVGITQDQLAVRIGCDQSFISKLERGGIALTLPMLWRIAGALQVPPHALVREEERLRGEGRAA